MVAKNFTQFNKTNFEAEGVETCYIIVDYVNNMIAETSDPHGATTTTAGLELVRELIGSRVNILGQTALYDNNSQQAFLVRKDSISSSLLTQLQTDIRALSSDTRTQGLAELIGYWSQTTPVDNSQKKNYKLTFDSAPSDTNNFTFSCWFRGTGADMESELPGGTNTTYLFENFAGAGNGGFLIVLENANAVSGAQAQVILYQGGASGAVNFRAQPGGSASFDSKYLNNEWHHIFVQIRGDLTGSALANQNRIFLDGVDVTTQTISGTPSGTAEVTTKNTFAGNGTNLRESTIDIADVYADFGTATDYTSDISAWYNSGHVNLGTDGTGGGASQPSIWLHESNGSVVHGGSVAGTVALEGDAGGVVTVYEGDGPRGSGLNNNCTVVASDFATKTADAVTPDNIPS
jgi:hypothetical protein